MSRVDESVEVEPCSFCGQTQPRSKIVHGMTGRICADCVALCQITLLEREGTASEEVAFESLPQPRAIFDHLGEYVVGQERAKRTLSVAVYNHYKRASRSAREQSLTPTTSVTISKSNLLLIGPSGSGKTYLLQCLARFLKVPFVIVDATTLSETGYVGQDVDSIGSALLRAADNDVAVAQRGIVYIDEIDKIGRRGSSSADAGRDVSGEGVQQALLKLLEGSALEVPKGSAQSRSGSASVMLDTTDVLFIAGGAFGGVERLVKTRLGAGRIGFGGELGSHYDDVNPNRALEPEDLVEFGLIPEFIGRLPVSVTLDALTRDDLIRIMTEPRDAIIKQFVALLEFDSISLEFESAAIEAVASQALLKQTGARGLRAIIESVLEPVMFDGPSVPGAKRVVVTRANVETGSAPAMDIG